MTACPGFSNIRQPYPLVDDGVKRLQRWLCLVEAQINVGDDVYGDITCDWQAMTSDFVAIIVQPQRHRTPHSSMFVFTSSLETNCVVKIQFWHYSLLKTLCIPAPPSPMGTGISTFTPATDGPHVLVSLFTHDTENDDNDEDDDAVCFLPTRH